MGRFLGFDPGTESRLATEARPPDERGESAQVGALD